MKIAVPLLNFILFAGIAGAQVLHCDLHGYKVADGIKADVVGDAVSLVWRGESDQQLRAQFTLRAGQPIVKELAVRKAGGGWVILGTDLTPEFQVTTGKRRFGATEKLELNKLKLDTPEFEETNKWNVFWDSPLTIPGTQRLVGPGRTADEIHRATSTYKADTCSVKTDGAHVSITFNGLALGLFAGDLQFTAYSGSNLLRQEAIAETDAPSVAYIYKAGLKGFNVKDDTKLVWRDTAQVWQEYDFGGAPNNEPVNLRARNRLEILDVGAGSIGIFPPPHKFFFARENEVNLGYVYYRKDDGASFSIGVMQPEHGEGYPPWGISDAEWKHRVNTSREQVENYALYNAPPGKMQRMAIYYYLNAAGDHATQQSVMAYTHNDVFKPLPGYKVITGHFHLDLNEMLRDRGTLDYHPSWVPVFRDMGINIVYLGDFHDDSDIHDPGPLRFMEQKIYFEGSRRLSDKNFLVMPAEEPNAYLGGHWYLMTPRPVYFSHSEPRPANQPFEEEDPTYGHVYHLGSSDDIVKMLNKEQGIIWTAHPRTKSSVAYLDAYKTKDFFLSDRFIGASWESLPVDLSQERLCPIRCFGVNDDMSNWASKPKFMLAEGDTYTKRPDDDTYPFIAVNYLKLDKVPLYNESWLPIVEGIRKGDFFGTTGEILFHNWPSKVQGQRASIAQTLNTPFLWSLQRWSGATGLRSIDRLLI
jgi:hypothetical protein